MEENSSDSEHGYLEGPADSHTLSTRRKRRKTRGERNRLFDKSKHKKNHNKEVCEFSFWARYNDFTYFSSGSRNFGEGGGQET